MARRLGRAESVAVDEAILITAEITGSHLSREALRMLVADLVHYPPEDVLAALRRCRLELRGGLDVTAVLERMPGNARAVRSLHELRHRELLMIANEIQNGGHLTRRRRREIAELLAKLALNVLQPNQERRGRPASADTQRMAGIAHALMLVYAVSPKVAVRAAIDDDAAAFDRVYKKLSAIRRTSTRTWGAEPSAFAAAVDRLPASARGRISR